MDDNLKPSWINISNFISVLKHQDTQNVLSDKICKFSSKKDPIVTESHEGDAKAFLPTLLCNLRMFDISDSKYWGVSFIGVTIFLLIESLIFLFNNIKFVTYLGAIAIGIVILVGLYFAIFFFFLREIKMKNFFYTIPVILTSLGLIILNFLLILFTGWEQSPFLPAFLFTNLTIISAPRENSRTIYFLTAIAFFLLFIPYFTSGGIDYTNADGSVPDFSELGKTINMLTLFFTVGIVVVSRSFSSKKILNKQENEK